MKLRYYQEECIKSLYDWVHTQTTNPLCVLATAAGKSIIIAQFIKIIMQQYPKSRFICCIDTKELVAQNYLKLLEVWKTAPAGIFSAGLKKRDTEHPILFTGIQSIYNKAVAIGQRDFLIIDEAHMANLNEGSMWEQFISELKPNRIIGLTATPYRNDCGLIYTGDNTIFGGLCYDYTIKQGIKDKYLSEIIPKRMMTRFDVSGVKKQNGDFSEKELQEVVNIHEINKQVVNEIIECGKDRKGWLIFSAGCDHAHQLDILLKEAGYNGGVILGDTPSNKRDELIQDFKDQKIRYLINNAVLTKGFDAPHIDLLAAVRPTVSPVLWTQMIGRAFRLCEGKENALLLDFADNIFRFGYIDTMIWQDKIKINDEEGTPVVKECPDCQAILPAAVRECKHCGYQFPPPEPTINTTSYNGAVLSTQVVPEWKDVETVYYSKHIAKKTNIPILKVEYICKNFERYYEWICLEHEGYARTKAFKWWKANTDLYQIKDKSVCDWIVQNRMFDSVPTSVDDALKLKDGIIIPSKIKVMEDEKFWKVLERDNQPPVQECQPEPEHNFDFSEEAYF